MEWAQEKDLILSSQQVSDGNRDSRDSGESKIDNSITVDTADSAVSSDHLSSHSSRRQSIKQISPFTHSVTQGIQPLMQASKILQLPKTLEEDLELLKSLATSIPTQLLHSLINACQRVE